MALVLNNDHRLQAAEDHAELLLLNSQQPNLVVVLLLEGLSWASLPPPSRQQMRSGPRRCGVPPFPTVRFTFINLIFPEIILNHLVFVTDLQRARSGTLVGEPFCLITEIDILTVVFVVQTGSATLLADEKQLKVMPLLALHL